MIPTPGRLGACLLLQDVAGRGRRCALKILVLCLFYGLVFGVVLALEHMAHADIDQWRLRSR